MILTNQMRRLSRDSKYVYLESISNSGALVPTGHVVTSRRIGSVAWIALVCARTLIQTYPSPMASRSDPNHCLRPCLPGARRGHSVRGSSDSFGACLTRRRGIESQTFKSPPGCSPRE